MRRDRGTHTAIEEGSSQGGRTISRYGLCGDERVKRLRGEWWAVDGRQGPRPKTECPLVWEAVRAFRLLTRAKVLCAPLTKSARVATRDKLMWTPLSVPSLLVHRACMGATLSARMVTRAEVSDSARNDTHILRE